MKYIFKNFFSRFWKTPKNFIFQFLFLLGLDGMIFIFSRDWNFSFPRKEKSSLFKKNLFFYLTN